MKAKVKNVWQGFTGHIGFDIQGEDGDVQIEFDGTKEVLIKGKDKKYILACLTDIVNGAKIVK